MNFTTFLYIKPCLNAVTFRGMLEFAWFAWLVIFASTSEIDDSCAFHHFFASYFCPMFIPIWRSLECVTTLVFKLFIPFTWFLLINIKKEREFVLFIIKQNQKVSLEHISKKLFTPFISIFRCFRRLGRFHFSRSFSIFRFFIFIEKTLL